jgi:amino acid transporter
MPDIKTAEGGAGVMLDVADQQTMRRDVTWKGVFWIASGVPVLVLFTIGSIGATALGISWLVWIISILMGFSQSFTYAEIAGLFPGKSGGASVYGAIAWVRYSKWIAPISVWGNWYAWSPVLAIGTGLASGYILNYIFPADAKINTWSLTILNLGFLREGLELRVSAAFFLSVLILLFIFWVQHRGISGTAKFAIFMGVAGLVPLVIISFIPLFTGDVVSSNFSPLAPIIGENGAGLWGMSGWKLFLGALFICAWSTYGFETAVCYTSELKDPKHDTIRAVVYSGLLSMFLFITIPFIFQGHLGVAGLSAPDIYSGMGVAKAMAIGIGSAKWIEGVVVLALLLALFLCISTAMAGSSRTIYQASVDGWFPRYLSHLNKNGVPTHAMWTDLGFNVILLLMSDYVWVLAVSNVGYLTFNFLNLNSGWIHRIDSGNVPRPWKCPTVLIGFNTFLAFVNCALIGIGANVYGKGTLISAAVFTALIIPVFWFRHFYQDKGRFPDRMYEDLGISEGDIAIRKAGVLPYLALIAFVVIIVTLAIVFWNY